MLSDHDVAGAGHCIKAVRKRPPRIFEMNVSGDVCSSLTATVTFSREATKRLPLLDDLISVRASELFEPALAVEEHHILYV